MRNFAKIAVDEGMISTSDVERSIAKMNDAKALEPTGDLFTDMAKLAAALRKRGYVEEADGIEQKMFMFKQAEGQFYDVFGETGDDLIEFAHQDGEAEVAPSSGGYGVVETEITGQKKRVDVVNKKPTGKYASEIKSSKMADMLLLASEALDIRKSGQAEPEEPPKPPADVDIDDPVQVNDQLRVYFDQIETDLKPKYDAALNLEQDALKLTQDSIWNNETHRAFYEKAAGLSAGTIKKLFDNVTAAYGKGDGVFGAPEDITAKIMSMNYDQLKDWAPTADAWSGFFNGSRPHHAKKDIKQKAAQQFGGVANDQGSSIWVVGDPPEKTLRVVMRTTAIGGTVTKTLGFRKEKSFAAGAAKDTIKRHKAQWDKIIKPLNKVQERINTIVNETKTNTSAAWGSWKSLPKFTYEPKSNADVIISKVNSQASAIESIANPARGGKSFKREFGRLAEGLGAKIDWAALLQVSKDVRAKTSEINALLTPASAAPMHGALSNFREAKKIFDAQMKKFETKPESKEYLDAKARSARSAQFIGWISGGLKRGGKRGWKWTKRQSKSNKSPEQWIAGSKQWLEGAKALAGIKGGSSRKINIIKLAQDFNPANTSAQSPTGGGTAPTPKRPGKWRGKAPAKDLKISEEEKAPVRIMQDRIHTLGSDLSSGKYDPSEDRPEFVKIEKQLQSLKNDLLATGRQKTAGTPKDGEWSRATAKGLKAAELIRKTWNENENVIQAGKEIWVGPDKGYYGQSNTVEKAQSNIEALNILIEAITGKNMAVNKGKSYGKFRLKAGGPVYEIYELDLATLEDLLNFLLRNKEFGNYSKLMGHAPPVMEPEEGGPPSPGVKPPSGGPRPTGKGFSPPARADDTAYVDDPTLSMSLAERFAYKLSKKGQMQFPEDKQKGKSEAGEPERDYASFGLTESEWNEVLNNLEKGGITVAKQGGPAAQRAAAMIRQVDILRKRLSQAPAPATKGGVVPLKRKSKGRYTPSGPGARGYGAAGFSRPLGGGMEDNPIGWMIDLRNDRWEGLDKYTMGNVPIFYKQLRPIAGDPAQVADYFGIEAKPDLDKAFNSALHQSGLTKDMLKGKPQNPYYVEEGKKKYLRKDKKFKKDYKNAQKVSVMGTLRKFVGAFQTRLKTVVADLAREGLPAREFKDTKRIATKWNGLLSNISSAIRDFYLNQ